jgi:hypothetical protein
MPRVHKVEKARKNYGDSGIKKGDTYYWWKFNYGPKIRSKKYPSRSQLTRSDFLGTYYDIVDGFSPDIESIEDDVACLIDSLDDLRDDQQERLDAMPEHLQDTSSSGEMLQERIDGLEGWIDSLQNIDFELEENISEEGRVAKFEEWVSEVLESDPGF